MAIDAIFPNVFQTVVRKIRTRRSNGVAARSTAKTRRRFLLFILAQGGANFEGEARKIDEKAQKSSKNVGTFAIFEKC